MKKGSKKQILEDMIKIIIPERSKTGQCQWNFSRIVFKIGQDIYPAKEPKNKSGGIPSTFESCG